MAKKKKGGSGKKGGGGGDGGDMLKRKDVLQAVLLADSFKVCFRPMTLDKPKVLLPLVNVPMINYTLEFLASSGVEEVFLLCGAHADQIERHLKTSDYNRMMNLQVVYCENCYSAGDALRHLDQMRVLKSDFVLIGGDVISNINFKHVLDLHKKRRKDDKLNIMTVILKRADPLHRTRGHEDRAILVLDSDTKQMLVYDNDTESGVTDLEVSLIAEHPKVEICHDLMDTHIYVCGLEVLDLLTENFDWQDIQRHFVRGVLGDNVLGNKIFSHIISGEYAARVQDPKSYHAISKDVIQRWTYPMVLENNLISDTTYKVFRHNVYKESKVHIDRSTKITSNTVIGAGTVIGKNCLLDRCIIGRNVTIGDGAVLRRCYLWDGCRIGANVSVSCAILADGVTVNKGSQITENCLLGYGVVVGSECKIPPNTRLCGSFEPAEDCEELEELIQEGKDKGAEIIGMGKGIVYSPDMEDITDDQYPSYCLVPSVEVKWAEESDGEMEDGYSDSDEGGKSGDEKQREAGGGAMFEKEMLETLHRGMKNNLDVDAIVLEAGSLKLTHHALLKEYYAAAFLAFFTVCTPQPVEGKKAERNTLKSLIGWIKKWKSVLAKFAKQVSDQQQLLRGLTICCTKRREYLEVFNYTVNLLYQWELVEEDAILEWEDEVLDKGDEAELEVLKRGEDFLTYLKEAEEESGDSDD